MSNPSATSDGASLQARCERGVQIALDAGADAAEVYAHATRATKVGFQKNDLDSVSTGDETTFGVRVISEGRLGFVTANQAGDLDQVAREAVQIARASPPDEHNVLPDPQPLPPVPDLVAEDLAELGAAGLADLGRELLAMLLAWEDPGGGGTLSIDTMEVSVHDGIRAVASSTGVGAHHRAAWAQGEVFGMAIDGAEVGSFSYDGDAVRSAAELRPALEVAFGRFATKCMGALRPRAGESFRGPVLVPADALGGFLVGTLVGTLSASTVRQGLSPFADKLGERIAAPGFTLREGGGGLDGHPITPFDREGMPRQRLALVEDGVLGAFLYDGAEARRAGRTSTGHAQGGASSLPSIGSAVLSIDAGDVPLAQLQAMDRGIELTRFAGTVQPTSGDFSGVVKGGFLIKDGDRVPVKETTIAGNLWTALKNISARSATTTTFYGTRRYPALVIEDVSITAG